MPSKGIPVSGPKGKGLKKKKDDSDLLAAQAPPTEDDDFYKEPIKRIVKPENQLKLDEVQLSEEFTRVLTANDPNIPNNVSKYNYKEKSFKQDPVS